MGDTIELCNVPLAELVALYNNYLIVQGTDCGSAWAILNEQQFDEVEKEIKRRIDNINFFN